MPADIRFSVAFLEWINNEKITLHFSSSRRHIDIRKQKINRQFKWFKIVLNII